MLYERFCKEHQFYKIIFFNKLVLLIIKIIVNGCSAINILHCNNSIVQSRPLYLIWFMGIFVYNDDFPDLNSNGG